MSYAKIRKRYKRQLEKRDASLIRQRRLNQPNQSVITLFFRKTQIMLVLFFAVLFLTSLVFLYDDSPIPLYSDEKIIALFNTEPQTQNLLLPLPNNTKIVSSTIEKRYSRGSLSSKVPHNYYLASWNGYHFLFYINGDSDERKVIKYLRSYARFPVSWLKIGKTESEILNQAKKLYPDFQIVSSGMFKVIERSHWPTNWIIISLLVFYMLCKTLYRQMRIFKTYKRLYPDSI